jgi:hypothetical protein
MHIYPSFQYGQWEDINSPKLKFDATCLNGLLTAKEQKSINQIDCICIK